MRMIDEMLEREENKLTADSRRLRANDECRQDT